MEIPKIIKQNELEWMDNYLGGKEGKAGRVSLNPFISPDPNARGLAIIFGEVNPGFAAHRWHTHTYDKCEITGIEVNYPEGFEELYYITKGKGVLQWELEDGTVVEKEVSSGDIVFFPAGVYKHQLLNNGSEKMIIVGMATPYSEMTPVERS